MCPDDLEGFGPVGTNSPKLVNAAYGYDMVVAGRPPPWWQLPQFPLVPMWDYRPADKHNPSAWSFSWLFFRYWSLDHIELKLDVGFDVTGMGGSAFRIGAILPYTRLMFSVPLPIGWLYRFHRRPPAELRKG